MVLKVAGLSMLLAVKLLLKTNWDSRKKLVLKHQENVGLAPTI